MERMKASLVASPWLYLLTMLIILAPLVEGGTSHFAVMAIRLSILIWIMVYLWASIESRTFRYWTSPHLFVVLLFLIVAVYSTARSAYTHQSLQWLLVLFSYAGLFYLIVLYLRTWEHIRKILLVVFGVGAVEVVWAGIQALQGMVRPTGTFFNPNFLSGYLAVSFTVILAYVIHLPLRDFHWKFWKKSTCASFIRLGLPLLLLVLFLMMILISGSRGALFAVMAGAMVTIGIRFGWKGQALIMLLLLMLVILPNPLQERVRAEHDRNPATYSRIQMWGGAIQEMGDHPWGVGLGLYQYFAPQYAFPIEGQIVRYGQVSRTAHNEFLQIGVEMGVIGLLIFLAGIVFLMLETTRVLRKTLTRIERAIVVGAGGGVTVILTHAMVDSNLHVPSIAVLLILLAAILLAASRLTGARLGLVREWPIKRVAVWRGIAVLLLGGTLLLVMKFSLAWMVYESGLEAFRAGNMAKALTSYQEALSIDPTKALYRSALASVFYQKYQSSGNLTDAQHSIDELQRAIELNPIDGRLYGLLGHLLYTAGSSFSMAKADDHQGRTLFQEAYEAYQTALQYEPFSVFHRLELARVSLALGEAKRGEAFVQEAIVIEPNFLSGREWLAKRLWHSGRKADALSQIQEIVARKNKFVHIMSTKLEKEFLRADLRALETMTKSVG